MSHSISDLQDGNYLNSNPENRLESPRTDGTVANIIRKRPQVAPEPSSLSDVQLSIVDLTRTADIVISTQ